ncbi:MAG: flavodoxin domain-containing protein [Spirochaetaceae bacterium]|nr:flavodoxin domain-containing protein [Spirochaetaceae bacterium]
MKKTIVLYRSKYGATKKYADWLAEELSCDVLDTKQADISKVGQYDIVILGGGIYAGGIAGLSFIKKHYKALKDKKIIIFAVGAVAPGAEKNIEEIKARHLKNDLANIPFFYFRGAWNEEVMTWIDRKLCTMLQKSLVKKDPTKREPWESAFVQSIGLKLDWTNKESLKPIIEMAMQNEC